MKDIRIIFSPHTADPQFVAEVAAAVMAAQFSVAHALWGAQFQALRAVLMAQLTFMDSVNRAALRPR